MEKILLKSAFVNLLAPTTNRAILLYQEDKDLAYFEEELVNLKVQYQKTKVKLLYYENGLLFFKNMDNKMFIWNYPFSSEIY
jgi:hypothetical protein